MSSSGSTTVHNIEINYITKGLDIYSTQANSAAVASEKLAGSSTKLNLGSKVTNDSFAKSSVSVKAYSGAISGLDPSLNRAVGGLTKTNTVVKTSVIEFGKAGKSMDGMSSSISRTVNSALPFISRISGMSFAFIGLKAAMDEARGMQEILALSQKKVSDLQAEQTMLVQQGAEGSKEYKRVTDELTQAQAALTRQQTITNLSAQDQYFFLASIAAQAIPNAVKGFGVLSEKIAANGKGFSGFANLLKTGVTSSIVGLAEKTGLLPPLFTSAGTSANSFGTALKLLALNPFTIAILAATTALTLFVTNAFGFRDAIYGIGKAIGDALPFVKPLLEGLQFIGDGILKVFGAELPEAAAESTKGLEKINLELSETEVHMLELDQSLQVLNDYVTEWEQVQYALHASSEAVGEFNNTYSQLQQAIKDKSILESNNFYVIYDQIDKLQELAKNATPEIQRAISSFMGTFNTTFDNTDAKLNELTKDFLEIRKTILTVTNPVMAAQIKFQDLSIEFENNHRVGKELIKLYGIDLSGALSEDAVLVTSLSTRLTEQNSKFKESRDLLAEFLLENKEWMNATEIQKNNLLNQINLIDALGDSLVLSNDGIVDVTQSLVNMTQREKEFGVQAQIIWSQYQKDIESGKISIGSFSVFVDALKDKNLELGTAVEDIFKKYQDSIKDTSKDQIDFTLEAKKTIDEILRIETEGIPAIKRYADTLKGLDDTFTGISDSINKKATEAIMKAIDKDGSIDKFLKKAKVKINDNLKFELTKNAFVFSADSEDGVKSLIEKIVAKVKETGEPLSEDVGNEMIAKMFKKMEDAAGKNKTLVDKIREWKKDFDELGNLHGEAYRTKLLEILVSAADTEQLSALRETFGDKVIDGIITKLEEKKPDIKQAGNTLLGVPVVEGFTLGLEGIPPKIDSDVTPAVKDSMVLMTAEAIGLVNTMLDDEVNTTIPGYAGLFATAFTNLGATASNFVTEAIKHIGQFNLIMSNEVSVTIPGFVTLLATQFTLAGQAVAKMVDETKTQLDLFNKYLTASEGRVTDFVNKSLANLVKLRTGFGNLGTSISEFSKQLAKDMDSASSKFDSFTSKMLANLVKLRTGFGNATTQANELKKAIDSLKDKTITVTTKYKTEGEKPGNRFGGSFINSVPTHIGGKAISEGGKPELVTITPLTDPHTNDTQIDFGSLNPKVGSRKIDTGLVKPTLSKVVENGGSIVSTNSNISSSSVSGIGGGNIVVRGLMQVNMMLPNGRVLYKMMVPYMMEGMAGSV